jgi:putative addiction module component (TIGR02574 family)
MATADEVLADALQLSPDERARLAHKLLLSLEEQEADPEAEAVWAQELERRVQEVVSGSVQARDARKFIEDVRARLRERHGR